MYVFGIDMPLMEILFVLFIIDFVASVFIWLEVRKMSTLLKIEKGDITHLDSDIKLLDSFIQKNPSEMLENYVSDRLEHGTPKRSIRTSLNKAGFDNDTVSKIFKKLK